MQVNVLNHQLNDLFDKAQRVLVVLGETPNEDQGALATGLVEFFTSYKKNCLLVTKGSLSEVTKTLVKEGQLRDKIEAPSLVISFDLTKNNLDKVSYAMEGNKFKLIIANRGDKLSPSDLSFSYKGGIFDLIVTVGVGSKEQLLTLGLDEDIFNKVATVNFDKSVTNKNFAKLNIVNPNVDSVCSLVTNAFKQANVTLPTKTAEMFLYGIRFVTANFTKVTDPNTFEAAAYLKRSMIPGSFAQTQQASTPVERQENKADQDTPEGWLSPKIYRSSRAS